MFNVSNRASTIVEYVANDMHESCPFSFQRWLGLLAELVDKGQLRLAGQIAPEQVHRGRVVQQLPQRGQSGLVPLLSPVCKGYQFFMLR